MKTKRKIAGIATAILCTVNAVSVVVPSVNADESATETVSEEMIYNDCLVYSLVDKESDGVYDYAQITGCDRDLTEIIIPSEIDGLPVTEIEEYAFFYYKGTSVIIPNSITSIGQNAFWLCTALSNISIPDSVTSIGKECFKDCYNMTKINLACNITTISEHTFNGCQSLTEIIIPNSVTTISEGAFCGCTALESIEFPDSVECISPALFADVNSDDFYLVSEPSSLKSVNVSENNKNYKSVNGVLFNKDMTELVFYPYDKSTPQTGKNIIPDTVTTIGSYAFGYNCRVKNITIPESVTTIKSRAFFYCSALESITIENPNCEIEPSESINGYEDTISNSELYLYPDESESDSDSDYLEGYIEPIYHFDGIIYGHKDSAVQAFAETYNKNFEVIDNKTEPEFNEITVPEDAKATKHGDSNLDESINIADAVKLNTFLLNTSENAIEDTALANSDCVRDGVINTADSALLMNYVCMATTEEQLGKE